MVLRPAWSRIAAAVCFDLGCAEFVPGGHRGAAGRIFAAPRAAALWILDLLL
jgi:hypothetical protein